MPSPFLRPLPPTPPLSAPSLCSPPLNSHNKLHAKASPLGSSASLLFPAAKANPVSAEPPAPERRLWDDLDHWHQFELDHWGEVSAPEGVVDLPPSPPSPPSPPPSDMHNSHAHHGGELSHWHWWDLHEWASHSHS